MATDTSSDFDAQSFISRGWRDVKRDIKAGKADGHLPAARRAENSRDPGPRASITDALDRRSAELRAERADLPDGVTTTIRNGEVYVDDSGEQIPLDNYLQMTSSDASDSGGTPAQAASTDSNVDQNAPKHSDPMGYTDGVPIGPPSESHPQGSGDEDGGEGEEKAECGSNRDSVGTLKRVQEDPTPDTESNTKSDTDEFGWTDNVSSEVRGDWGSILLIGAVGVVIIPLALVFVAPDGAAVADEFQGIGWTLNWGPLILVGLAFMVCGVRIGEVLSAVRR